MPTVRVRSARAADAAAIADVHRIAVHELGSTAYDDRQVRAWMANVHPERYPIEETGAGFHLLVAERVDDDRVVGFGWLDCDPSERDAGTGEVVAVYVRPDHVREGIGRAILERLERIARDAGIETIVLVASKNAIEFYRGQGYEGEETVSIEMTDDVSLEALRMRKRLTTE